MGICPEIGWLSLRTLLWLFLCAELIFFPSAGEAQNDKRDRNYLIKTYQTEDGLPQNSINGIQQTPDGYLWFATFNGLVRYDGLRFTVFNPGNTPEIPNERIVRLDQDAEGGLWITSENHELTRLREGKFQSIKAPEGLPEAGADNVSIGPDKSIWLCDARMSMHRWENGRFVPKPTPSGIKTNEFYHFVGDATEKPWIMLHDRTVALPVGNGYEVLKDAQGVAVYVRAAEGAKDHGIWVNSGRKLWKMHGRTMGPVEWNYSPGERLSIYGMQEDRTGNVWIATFGQGLFCCTPSGEIKNYSMETGLSHNTLRSVFEDREGILWIGTDGGGLNRFKNALFRTYDARDGLGGNIIMTATEDRNGTVWFGSNGGGVNRLGPKGIEWMTNTPAYMTNRYIWSILACRNDDLWFGTWGNGLYRKSENNFTSWSTNSGILNSIPLVLFEDSAGSIWAGGALGLNHFTGSSIESYSHTNGLSSDDVRAVAEDRKGRLFVATDKGLNVRQEGKWQHYFAPQALSNDHLRSLWVDAEDVLWIGSSPGLTRFKDGKFYFFNEGTELSRPITTIVEDNLHYFWLFTDRGVMRISKESLNGFADGSIANLSVVNYGKSDGMGSSESSSSGRVQPAAWKTREGKIWFSSVAGVSLVDPSEVKHEQIPPPVYVEEVLGDDHILRDSNTSANGRERTIIVPASTERLEFHYTAINTTSPLKCLFKYRLNTFDKNWIEAGSRRVAYYTRVTPGTYHFQLLACNQDGVWTTSPASMAVVVLPHFWQTNWFRAMLVVSAMGLGFALYKSRIKHLELRRMEQDKFSVQLMDSQEAERKRIAGELHDSLGQNLLAIKNRALMGLKKETVPGDVADQLSEISSAASQAIREVRDLAHNLRPYQLDELGLTRALRHIIQFVTSPTRVEADVELENLDGLLAPGHEIHFYRVVQELLNNILRHSGATEVFVKGTRKDQFVTLIIHDNGNGFDTQAPGFKGFGLSGIIERVRLMGGKCDFDSSPANGTSVRLEIPVNQNGNN
ncbi:MAG: putative two-component system sensor kinase [Verrucomicrobiales bacterium]|nr:putative two-component system sensor kinase [Verrucomicrobiales bacterium]